MSEPDRSVVSSLPPSAPQAFGRYVLHAPIARGGMATIYIARLVGAEGFSRLVAAKRLHPQFTEDPEFVTMFHDEARIASRIHHLNVVPVLDVVLSGQEVIIVQEYVHGVPLDRLFKTALLDEEKPIPMGIVIAIIAGVLSGLHAAHETRDEMNEPLSIVHRDVSPQNVMVSMEGIPRLLDFGIAKATSSSHVTREGVFKGKVAYMAPEQLRAEEVTRAADIYAAGILLWELAAHRRLFSARGDAELFAAVLSGAIPSLTSALGDARGWMGPERWREIQRLEPIVSRSLATAAANRYATAADMRDALLAAFPAASTIDVASWVKALGADYLERRQSVLASSEESWRSLSKISTAPTSVPAESMVKLVARRSGEPTPLEPPSILPFGVTAAPPPDIGDEGLFARRPNLIPWFVTGALLLLVGVLLGLLGGVRKQDAVTAAARVAEPPPPPVVDTAPPTKPPPPEPAAVSATVAPARSSAPPPVATAVPMPRWTSPRAPAPPATHPSPPPRPTAPPVAAPSQAVAPAPPSLPPPKEDCDPPFYFEGTKKIFKPKCI